MRKSEIEQMAVQLLALRSFVKHYETLHHRLKEAMHKYDVPELQIDQTRIFISATEGGSVDADLARRALGDELAERKPIVELNIRSLG